MSELEWIGAIVAAVLMGLVAAGLIWQLIVRYCHPLGTLSRNSDGSFRLDCAVCAARVEVRKDDLARLSSTEKALVVREKPEVVGKDLVEFVCPHCDASHCFVAGRGAMQLVGVNLYEGQAFHVHCKECGKPLDTPPWPPGAYDGRMREAPGYLENLGVVCPFCGATSCMACCQITTKNRTADGSLLCPRCYRGPLDRFYHPTPARTGQG